MRGWRASAPEKEGEEMGKQVPFYALILTIYLEQIIILTVIAAVHNALWTRAFNTNTISVQFNSQISQHSSLVKSSSDWE